MGINWTPGITLDFLEQMAITQAMRFYQGNVRLTAQALGVSEKTIYNKLDKYKADAEPSNAVTNTGPSLDDQRFGRDRLGGGRASQVEEQKKHEDELRAQGRIRVESANQATKEQHVSMHERQEVQEVLPAKNAGGHNRRNR